MANPINPYVAGNSVVTVNPTGMRDSLGLGSDRQIAQLVSVFFGFRHTPNECQLVNRFASVD